MFSPNTGKGGSEKTPHLDNFRAVQYLGKNVLLLKYRWWFCLDILTDSNLKKFTDFDFRGMDKGFQAGMIQDDPQNTFYALDYTVLLQEMDFIKMDSQSLKYWRH